MWRRTHDAAGPPFKLLGVVAVLGVLVPDYAIALAVGPVLVVSTGPVGYSFYVYRRQETRDDAG